MDRDGGKLRVYGRCSFRDAGRTGRGEGTRVATLPKISGRVLTLSGSARQTGREKAAAGLSDLIHLSRNLQNSTCTENTTHQSSPAMAEGRAERRASRLLARALTHRPVSPPAAGAGRALRRRGGTPVHVRVSAAEFDRAQPWLSRATFHPTTPWGGGPHRPASRASLLSAPWASVSHSCCSPAAHLVRVRARARARIRVSGQGQCSGSRLGLG